MKIVLLTLFSAALIQVGYFIWKIAAKDLPRIGETSFWIVLKSFLTSWKWLLGMCLRLTGLFLFIKTSSIGAISLIEPLMASSDIFIVFLGVIFLKERLNTLEWTGLLCTILGAVTIALGAKVITPTAVHGFKALTFLIILAGTIAGLLVLAKHNKQREIVLGIAVGLTFGFSTTLIKLMTTTLVLSGQNVGLVNTIFNPFFPLLLASNISGVILLQMAFQNGRAAVIIPLQLSVVSGLAVLGGIVLFSEEVSIYRLGSISLIILGTVLFQYAGTTKGNVQVT